MTVIMVYILVLSAGGVDYVRRFVASYRAFPSGYAHTLLIVCNDCKPTQSIREMFAGIPCLFLEGDNQGWDIGAYQAVAQSVDADVMFCCGVSVNFRRPGWLRRLMEAWFRYGEGLYGIWASNQRQLHIRTTAFLTSPDLILAYPWSVVNHTQRYEFEHGDLSFWRLVESFGLPVLLVTWDGEWPSNLWRAPANIFRRGDQSNCLAFDNHCDGYEFAPPDVKAQLERFADLGGG